MAAFRPEAATDWTTVIGVPVIVVMTAEPPGDAVADAASGAPGDEY